MLPYYSHMSLRDVAAVTQTLGHEYCAECTR